MLVKLATGGGGLGSSSDDDVPDPRDHYERARPVYEALARVGPNPTIGNNDFVGWYIKRFTDDAEVIEDGFPQQGRVAQLDGDLDELLGRIDRTLYAITTYKRPEAFDRWVPCTIEDDQTVWRDEKPTPTEADLRAVPAWGDIDLNDDLKAERGSLDADTRATVEAALDAYVDEYADLYGDRGAVYALDSVGGAYIFGAPEATLPVADHYADDEAALARVLGEFIDRTNDWLSDAEERVNDRVDGAADVLDPDWVNNFNRQYKAPLSIHSSHDAVVTPLDPEAVEYDLTPLEDVDDELVDEAVAWAEAFTAEEHTDCVDYLVAKLWPDEYDAEGSWQAALDAWVDEQRRREEEQERRRREAMLERERHDIGGIEGQPITPHIQDVYDAIDALDAEAVAEQTIVHQWTDRASGKRDTSGSGKRAFIPTWGPNAEGTANYIDLRKGVWNDTGQGHYGGPVEMALYDAGKWNRGDDWAEGKLWAEGVDELRDLGFEIPVWTPDADTADGDQMPYWALRQAAVALEVLDHDGLEEREGDDGDDDTWLAIPDDRWDDVLEAVEDAGLDHGHDRRDEEYRDELDELLTECEDDDDPPGPTARYDIGRLLGQVSDEDFVDLYERAADVLGCEPWQVERHREREQYRQGFDTDEPVNLRPEDGKLWHISGVPLRRGRKPVLNFEWDVASLLDVPGEDTRIELDIEFDGQRIDRTVTTAVFHELRDFKKEVLVEPGMLFRPGEGSVTDTLNALDYLTFALDVPRLAGTKHMGLHGDEWVVPEGSLTPDGWTDEPETVYVEQGIPPERHVALPTDRHEYDPDDVATILRELPDTRPVDRMIPVIGWFYAAPFRPHIFDMEGEFNLLNITGDTGSGKTTTLRYLWRCFGMKDEPFSANDTPFAHTRIMASTNAIPTWYDEYKPGEIEKWKLDAFHNLIRKAATGGVEQRGNRDKTVDEYALRAPLAISGEQQIQPPAERRRSIMVTFSKRTTGEGTTYREAYKRLAGEAMMDDDELVIPEEYPQPEDHALAYIRYVTAMERETVAERWNDARRKVAEYRIGWSDEFDLDDLEVQGLQTILFGWETYLDFAEQHGVSRDELPGDVAVERALQHVAEAVGPGGRRVSHLERFIELMHRAAARGYLEYGEEFAVVNKGTESEEVRFHIDKTYDAISKYVRDHGLSGEDLFNAAHDYRKRISDRYVPEKEVEDGAERDPLIVSFGQKTPPVGRCTGIKTREAATTLNFDPGAFGATGGDGGDEEERGVADRDEAVALVNLPPEGEVTIEAEVEVLETPAPTGDPGASGALRDETRGMDFVCWRDLDGFETRPEQGKTYRFERVLVGEHNGAPQIVLNPTVTTAEPIQSGVGNSPGDDPGENEELAAASNDGEIEDATGRVKKYLLEVPSGETVDVTTVAAKLMLPANSAKHALDNLATSGRLRRTDDPETFEVL